MKNDTLRIAIVSDAIYPYNKGGKEKRIYEISTRLAKAGHDVHIYCMNWMNTKEPIKKNGVTLHGISKVYPLYAGQRRSITQALLFAFSCFKLLREDFDVIEVDHMPHFVLFSTKIVTLIKRKKLHATWNEVWGRKYWVEYMGKLGNIAYLIEWLSSRMPDKIIAVSQHTKNKLITDLKIKTEIIVIPNGIALEEINTAKPAKQKSDVIFVGRLLSHKNVDFLIDSVNLLKNKYPNITCVIVGKGPEEENLKRKTKKLKLEKNIIFYDFLPNHQDLYGLMKSSKVFAFPSTREGFGIAALEANASGIPVITTNHADNATKDLITNGTNGEVIQLDEKKIAEKIMNYIIANDSSDEYTQSAKKYDWDNLAKRVEEVYRQ